jgi:hypothetical protein
VAASDGDQLKEAYAHFRKAAGMFGGARHLCSALGNELTADMSPDCLQVTTTCWLTNSARIQQDAFWGVVKGAWKRLRFVAGIFMRMHACMHGCIPVVKSFSPQMLENTCLAHGQKTFYEKYAKEGAKSATLSTLAGQPASLYAPPSSKHFPSRSPSISVIAFPAGFSPCPVSTCASDFPRLRDGRVAAGTADLYAAAHAPLAEATSTLAKGAANPKWAKELAIEMLAYRAASHTRWAAHMGEVRLGPSPLNPWTLEPLNPWTLEPGHGRGETGTLALESLKPVSDSLGFRV